MAEKVTDGVNGLHFAAGDAASLAQAIARAASTPGLWQKLAAGVPKVYDIAEQVRVMDDVYAGLLARRASVAEVS
jgi:glycosyltransferase involved in cell wall biosynthesis